MRLNPKNCLKVVRVIATEKLANGSFRKQIKTYNLTKPLNLGSLVKPQNEDVIAIMYVIPERDKWFNK